VSAQPLPSAPASTRAIFWDNDGVLVETEHLYLRATQQVASGGVRTGLLKYFDFVLTASDYRRVKPDPEPYLLAVDRSGVAREVCVAIDDSARGLESATRAGIRCIVVPTALTRRSNFSGAHRVLGSIGEISGAL
jgi:beta-phosphoglucomutase-like phosphatase (HAD superfamily)